MDLSKCYESYRVDMKPVEFEKYCMEVLKAYAEKEKLQDFSIVHNIMIPKDGSNYQIDVFAEYTALGATNKVLVECKKYKNPVKRSVVELVDGRVKNLGMNKGILISTTGFQSGAVEYAKAHGVSLWQIVPSEVRHIVAAAPTEEMQNRFLIERMVNQNLPEYCVLEWNPEDGGIMEDIYPTPKMIREARNKVLQDLEGAQP